MKVLFDCFKYTDEYFAKIESGVIAKGEQFNPATDCTREKILVNLKTIKGALPDEDGKYTWVVVGDTQYILDVPFNDFLQICPHITYTQLKSKWAN